MGSGRRDNRRGALDGADAGVSKSCAAPATLAIALAGLVLANCNDMVAEYPRRDLQPRFSASLGDVDMYLVVGMKHYGYRMVAGGGDGELTYVFSGELPRGLSYGNDRVSGTPTEAKEETTYALTVNDSDGDTDTLEFTIKVLEQGSRDWIGEWRFLADGKHTATYWLRADSECREGLYSYRYADHCTWAANDEEFIHTVLGFSEEGYLRPLLTFGRRVRWVDDDTVEYLEPNDGKDRVLRRVQ